MRHGFGVDVSDKDRSVPIHELATEFVQGVFTTVGNFGVNGFDSMFLTRPLGNGEFLFQGAIPASGQLFTVRARRGVFAAQVDSDSAGS